MSNNNLSLLFAATAYKLILVCCPPTSLLNNMEQEADVTRSFLRHLRFNSGDMNTIFESGARKLNGQTAAKWGICALDRYFKILCS